MLQSLNQPEFRALLRAKMTEFEEVPEATSSNSVVTEPLHQQENHPFISASSTTASVPSTSSPASPVEPAADPSIHMPSHPAHVVRVTCFVHLDQFDQFDQFDFYFFYFFFCSPALLSCRSAHYHLPGL